MEDEACLLYLLPSIFSLYPLQVFESAVSVFVSLWREMRDEERQKEAEEEEAFKTRVKETVFGSLEGGEEEELRAMRELFPDHEEHFADLDEKEHVMAEDDDKVGPRYEGGRLTLSYGPPYGLGIDMLIVRVGSEDFSLGERGAEECLNELAR